MRFFSYQNKRRIKIALAVFCSLILLLALFCLCRFLYLQRYLIYSDNEVTLDYSQDLDKTSTKAQTDTERVLPEIITEEPVAQASSQTELPLQVLSGNYITTQMLLDMETVSSALSSLEDFPDTLMLDLKSIYGNFYYSSGTVGAITSSADIDAVDALIERLSAEKDLYLIARIASLSDTNFALANQSCGLPLRSGALWMSEEGCYWLDPMEEDVQDYLISIAQELAAMGFDEVVFDDFRIPDSKNIIYNGDVAREEAAGEAASVIREKLSDLPIRVSFNSAVPNVASHSDRVFLVTEDGSAVADLVKSMKDSVEDPASEIVFLTPSRDTRFDGYGILRPLIEAREE